MSRRFERVNRRSAVRDARVLFTLVLEGRNTEPEYFRVVHQRYGASLIRLDMVPGAGDPSAIAGRAVELLKVAKRESGKNAYEKHDQVWAVFDRDEHPHFDAAIARCQSVGVRVARSNPCFELWSILHHRDHDAPDDRYEVQRQLSALCPEYDPRRGKNVDCSVLIRGLAEAEQRALSQLQRRENERNPFGRPSTTVGELTRAMREASERAAISIPHKPLNCR